MAKDINGVHLVPGMVVARATSHSHSASLSIQVVTKVDGEKAYLDGSKQYLRTSESTVAVMHSNYIKFLGMTEEEATNTANNDCLVSVIASVDGHPRVMLRDFNRKRLNFYIENGVVAYFVLR